MPRRMALDNRRSSSAIQILFVQRWRTPESILERGVRLGLDSSAINQSIQFPDHISASIHSGLLIHLQERHHLPGRKRFVLRVQTQISFIVSPVTRKSVRISLVSP